MTDTPRHLSDNLRYRTPNEAVREALEDEVKSLRSTVAELERENAALRKDAERGRWLIDRLKERKTPDNRYVLELVEEPIWIRPDGTIDDYYAAIDAAMEKATLHAKPNAGL